MVVSPGASGGEVWQVPWGQVKRRNGGRPRCGVCRAHQTREGVIPGKRHGDERGKGVRSGRKTHQVNLLLSPKSFGAAIVDREREGASDGGFCEEEDGATELEGRADCLY